MTTPAVTAATDRLPPAPLSHSLCDRAEWRQSAIVVDAIPAVLRERPRWVLWRHVLQQNDDGTWKWKKPPYRVAHPAFGAKSTDPTTWSAFAPAYQAFVRGTLVGDDPQQCGVAEGIGFVLGRDETTSPPVTFTGFDIDDCRDPQTGVLDAQAEEYITLLDSYTEISPSGTGLHVLMIGTKPADAKCKKRRADGVTFESYDRGRYLTMTGHHHPGTPLTVNERTAQIATLAARLWPAAAPTAPAAASPLAAPARHAPGPALTVTGGDEIAAVIADARHAKNGETFWRAWHGDLAAYDGDDSAADLGVLSTLAYWSNNDPVVMEQAFNRSALAARDKWRDRPDYRQRTIAQAIAGCAPTAFEQEVRRHVRRKRAAREGDRRVEAEADGPLVYPPIVDSLTDFLTDVDAAVPYRLAAVQPAHTRVVLAATRKSGKTVLVHNLLRSLVDGDPFLGRYAVTPFEGTVGLIDNEMSRPMLKVWLRDQQIRHGDRIIPMPLRGHAHTFDLRDARRFAWWRDWCRAHTIRYLILDPLRPVLDALGLNEHTDAGRFLTAFDRLLLAADVPEALITHHMGHLDEERTRERSRGDSALRDKPDVEWKLVRQTDKLDASPRFFGAYGRDVDLRESELQYDPATRRLTLLGGTRDEATVKAAHDAVLAHLHGTASPQSQKKIETALAGRLKREAVRAAIAQLLAAQAIHSHGRTGYCLAGQCVHLAGEIVTPRRASRRKKRPTSPKPPGEERVQ